MILTPTTQPSGNRLPYRICHLSIFAFRLAALPDDELTRFALRLVFTEHAAIPREGDFDFLAEAQAIFAPPQPKRVGKGKKDKTATPIKAATKKVTAKRKLAA